MSNLVHSILIVMGECVNTYFMLNAYSILSNVAPGIQVNRGVERRTTMTLGPLEYLVVGFEGNRFTGKILAELRAAQEKGIIRVIDLAVIRKDEQGNVAALELSDLNA